MQIEVAPASLVARMEIDSAADTAIPLPGSAAGFNPARVMLDGKEADAIARTPDGILWLLIPTGKHEAVLEGGLPQIDSIEIPLPLKPHRLGGRGEHSVSANTRNGLSQLNHLGSSVHSAEAPKVVNA